MKTMPPLNIFLNLLYIFSCYTAYSQQPAGDKILYKEKYKFANNTPTQKALYDTTTYYALEIIRPSFVVNSDCGGFGSSQGYTDAALGDNGGFLAVWVDERTGMRRIDAQLFDASNAKIGDVIRISESYNNWNSQPHVIFNSISKEYIVAWADDGANILLQRISESGIKIGKNITITDRYILNTNNPSLAVDTRGNMMATWTSQGLFFAGNDVYCRLLDAEGKPRGSSFSIMSPPTNHVSSYGWEKRIASDSVGNFLVVWSNYVNNRNRIVVQAIDTLGKLVGSNTIISDSQDSTNHYFPTVTSIKNDRHLVCWQQEGGKVLGRVYSIYKGIVSPQIEISNHRKGSFSYAASSNLQDKFIAVYSGWTESEAVNGILFLSSDGTITDSLHKVPEMYFVSGGANPNLSFIKENTFLLSYFGYRKTETDAFVQKFSIPYTKQGTAVKLGSDYCSSSQQKPITTINKFGESIVIWEDNKTSTPSLVAQIFNSQQQIGTNFFVNDTSLSNTVSDAFVTSDADGNFLVSFSGGNYSYKDLYIQKISRAGALIGKNKNITNQPYYYSSYKSIVRQNADGNYVLAWYNTGTIYSQCYFQIFDKNLNVVSPVKPLIVSNQNSISWIFDAAINSNNELFVLWSDVNSIYNTHSGKLKGMFFNSSGKSISDTIVFAALPDSREYLTARCTIDDKKNVIIAYGDVSYIVYDPKITFARMYDNFSTILTTSIEVNEVHPILMTLEFRNKKSFTSWYADGNIRSIYFNDNTGFQKAFQIYHYPFVFLSWLGTTPNYSIAISGDSLWVAYAEVVNEEKGYDISLMIQRLNTIDFNPYIELNGDEIEIISSPFPNPNFGHASIVYKLKLPLDVEISIYNVLGQKIRTVVKQFLNEGTYTASFDTKNLPSGIYFFYYKGMKAYTKKFIITK